MLCQNCPKRNTCTEPCAALKRELKKHERYQREATTGSDDTLDFLVNNPLVSPYDYEEMEGFFSSETEVNFPFLTPLQNKCLQLFYFEGKSYKQIAFQIAGNGRGKLSYSQVRRQLHSAKRAIREHFSYK
jgi:hypothetical protein